MSHFKDNFSKQSGTYAKYRPTYPDELYKYLATLTAGHNLAWDCGTGNGQSAVDLAQYYDTVYATDPSKEQIENALPHKRVTYKIEKAEHSDLENESADIVTIAQAIHWFEFDKFYTEVKRVLNPGGIIAAWAYGLPIISNEIDACLKHFHDEVIGEFWLYENKLIEKEYGTIPFPFQQLDAPRFTIKKYMCLDDLLGLVYSWSATQKFIDTYGDDPVQNLEKNLAELWGDREMEKELTWKLILKAGKK